MITLAKTQRQEAAAILRGFTVPLSSLGRGGLWGVPHMESGHHKASCGGGQSAKMPSLGFRCQSGLSPQPREGLQGVLIKCGELLCVYTVLVPGPTLGWGCPSGQGW